MPGTHENGSGESRLDRLEGLMALLIEDHVQFREEHKQLLTARKELSAAQRHTDERLNALTSVVDDIVRRRPPQ
jgi:hypothetical protein